LQAADDDDGDQQDDQRVAPAPDRVGRREARHAGEAELVVAAVIVEGRERLGEVGVALAHAVAHRLDETSPVRLVPELLDAQDVERLAGKRLNHRGCALGRVLERSHGETRIERRQAKHARLRAGGLIYPRRRRAALRDHRPHSQRRPLASNDGQYQHRNGDPKQSHFIQV